MDSTRAQLAAHPDVWAAVNDVFESHFPGRRLEADTPETEMLTLSMLLEYIPGASEELAAEFQRALSTHTNSTERQLDS